MLAKEKGISTLWKRMYFLFILTIMFGLSLRGLFLFSNDYNAPQRGLVTTFTRIK